MNYKLKKTTIISILEFIRNKILSDEFKNEYKMKENDFIRNRKLPFAKMILLMTKKGVKSLQNTLNETEKFLSNLIGEELTTVSKSAYSKAREKLNYKAFIELSNDIRNMFYSHCEYKRFRGFRLLGIDGSLVTLPCEEDIIKEFNTTSVVNQYKDKSKTIVQARVSVVYDLLNSIVVDAIITNSKTHEITISKENHFKTFKEIMLSKSTPCTNRLFYI